jgi:hypothetical protein
MKKPAVILATALSTVALAGAVGVGVASADPTTSPTPSATAAAPTTAPAQPGQKADRKADRMADRKADRKGKRDLLQRALHGEVVLGGKKHRVVDFQRGEVTAVSSSSITVKSTDGFTATYVVDAKTKVRQAKQQAAIGDVKTGDKVRVVATKDGSTLTANRIADRTK